MAHELEMVDGQAQAFYVKQAPWHNLGKILDSAPATGGIAMRQANLDWTVSMRTMYLANGTEVLGFKAITRDTDGKPLSVAGTDWTPVQNPDAFAFFDPLVADGKGAYESAGSLRGGQLTWVLAKLTESYRVIGDDVVDSYLLITNPFDGKSAVRARYTPIRVECMNKLVAAGGFGNEARFRQDVKKSEKRVADGKRADAVSIRHTPNVLKRLEQAQQVMGFAHKQAQDTAAAFQEMGRLQLKAAEIMDFIAECLPDNPEAKNHTRTENMRAEIMQLVDSGIGTNLPGVRGTLWGALNAVSEYYQHSKGVSMAEVIDSNGRVRAGQEKAYTKAEKHLTNLWFGTANTAIERATDLAVARIVRSTPGSS